MPKWVIKHKSKKLFWSKEYNCWAHKSDQCESYFDEAEKSTFTVPSDGIWVKAEDYGLEY